MTFNQAVVALRENEAFATVVREIERRKANALAYIVAADGPEFVRYQGAYRAFDELLSDIEKSAEIANLTSDNRRKRPE